MHDLSFLKAGAVQAAENLIGWRFYRQEKAGLVGGTIVETEAYTQEDAASHTFKGPSARNNSMFGPAGRLYVYFTYGMHYCVNIVTGNKGHGEGVLLRAIIPDKGITQIRSRRNNQPDVQLTNGPAKICQALQITIEHNGATLNSGEFLLLPPVSKNIQVSSSTRIGITKDSHRMWRFTLKHDR